MNRPKNPLMAWLDRDLAQYGGMLSDEAYRAVETLSEVVAELCPPRATWPEIMELAIENDVEGLVAFLRSKGVDVK